MEVPIPSLTKILIIVSQVHQQRSPTKIPTLLPSAKLCNNIFPRLSIKIPSLPFLPPKPVKVLPRFINKDLSLPHPPSLPSPPRECHIILPGSLMKVSTLLPSPGCAGKPLPSLSMKIPFSRGKGGLHPGSLTKSSSRLGSVPLPDGQVSSGLRFVGKVKFPLGGISLPGIGDTLSEFVDKATLSTGGHLSLIKKIPSGMGEYSIQA